MSATRSEPEDSPATLRARRLYVDTHQEPVVLLRRDSAVARAEGFEALSRVLVEAGGRQIIATLVQIDRGWLEPGEAGLSEAAWHKLQVAEQASVRLSHAPPLDSLSLMRARVYGNALGRDQWRAVMADVASGRYADIHLAALISACAGPRLALDEIVDLTAAMVGVGSRLEWGAERVMDKHSVGGLPGNRTTPIVVAIATAAGLLMPKTSSRAITSPAGTADTMETMAPVTLDVEAMRCVVEREGGCIIWGGAVNLSPADDIMIRVERALEIDSEGQLIASVLSKKLAAGATHVVVDMPVGPTAKVRDEDSAERLLHAMEYVAGRLGLDLTVVATDGSQPVGRGIGPALEARDVLAVLRNIADAPRDLAERALLLAGHVLERGGKAAPGSGREVARRVLADGRAWRKFQAICEAQGGLREPPVAACRHEIVAPAAGVVQRLDNRLLARTAKLAGAPAVKEAGVEMHVRLGNQIERGAALLTLHAATPGELDYALEFYRGHAGMIELADPALIRG